MEQSKEADKPQPLNADTVVKTIGIGIVGILTTVVTVLSYPVYGQPLTLPADEEQQCPPAGLTLDGTVVRVIDGDTVVVRSCVEYHVRLIDCWAPESRTTNAVEKLKGIKAKTRMQQLAANKTVRVHIPGQNDVTNMVTLGRILGRVWLMDDDKPQPHDLSAIMVRENLATTTKPSNQKVAP